MEVTSNLLCYLLILISLCVLCHCEKAPLPLFRKLKHNYPGQHHFGGKYTHLKFLGLINVNKTYAPHDTSSLRMSYALNKLGPPHSLGKKTIQISKRGNDSVTGRSGLQYIYHPIAFGPYLADKYGDPDISVLHYLDPVAIKKKFLNKQGILHIISYDRKGPKGHIALWDCDHLYEANDWIVKHGLITTEFWQCPDSNCERRKFWRGRSQYRYFQTPKKQNYQYNSVLRHSTEEKDSYRRRRYNRVELN